MNISLGNSPTSNGKVLSVNPEKVFDDSLADVVKAALERAMNDWRAQRPGNTASDMDVLKAVTEYRKSDGKLSYGFTINVPNFQLFGASLPIRAIWVSLPIK